MRTIQMTLDDVTGRDSVIRGIIRRPATTALPVVGW